MPTGSIDAVADFAVVAVLDGVRKGVAVLRPAAANEINPATGVPRTSVPVPVVAVVIRARL